MIVMKFGGSSVGDGVRIRNVAKLVKDTKAPRVVVVSAVGGVTDKLINIANKVVDVPTLVVEKEVDLFYREILIQHREALEDAVSDRKILSELLPEIISLLDQLKVALLGVGYLEDLTPKSLDYIMSFGERLSIVLVSGALRSMGVDAVPLTGFEAGLITDNNYGCAHPDHKASKAKAVKVITALSKQGKTPVVTGFVAGNRNGKITTLGRGGSDYTASLLGNYLSAKEVQIWTDVDGIMTTDPRIAKDAKLIDKLSYVEAMDLAYFGAKVIHSKMIEPAMIANIPVWVRNTFKPDCEGTVILRDQKKIKQVIKSVTVKNDVALLTVQGVGMAETPNIAGKIFSVLGTNGITIPMISGSSESNLSFIVNKGDLTAAVGLIEEEMVNDGFRGVSVEENTSIITVVGAGMQGTKGIAAKVFSTVSTAGVNIIMIAQGSSEVNISFVVKDADAKKAIVALHKKFIE
ncbi:MAG: aspartate kinase [Candidatus Altiarchaeota archaeon]